ncbi:MAG TPA: PAS domain-containing protein [Nannocystaceae bacterium]|nr:PAS domain-containing protein [Nannocystaceae bacterium]
MVEDPRLASAIPIGTVELDASMRIRAVSPAFLTIFGAAAEGVVGRSFDDLLSPRDRRGARAFFRDRKGVA